ncbi:MAG: hypothetical protein GWN86_19755, partial [Desulfobacterales bacterium]|nr:hypothetical protein [Desulfobacterales bacterium]
MTAPIEGAEASSRAVANAKTREIVDAIRSDVAGGRIPYQALKEIRTKIGASLTRPQILGDAPRGELKKLYAAITEDMKVAARAHGPEAERAFERAN